MTQRRYLFIGAHPDDPDVAFGGTALKLVRAGHIVKFVSLTNGDRGHQTMPPQELAIRRLAETQKAVALSGIAEYQVWDNHDCELIASLENRKEVIRLIRQFKPDVVISHRTCDYHADHRATAQLVMDSAYLVRVPAFCNETPIPDENPTYAFCYDSFCDPRPVKADAVVEIDSVFEDKCRMLDCHESQFYEWIPWNIGAFHINKEMSWEQKRDWLEKTWFARFKQAADMTRPKLLHNYGAEIGNKISCVEVFEQSEYGRQISAEEFQALFEIVHPE